MRLEESPGAAAPAPGMSSMKHLRYAVAFAALLCAAISAQSLASYRSEQSWIAIKARQIVGESGAADRKSVV